MSAKMPLNMQKMQQMSQMMMGMMMRSEAEAFCLHI